MLAFGLVETLMPYRPHESAAIILRMREIIQSLGGPAEVGRHLGVRSQAVSLWGSTGRIPVERVPALLRLAKERGIELTAWDLRNDIDWAAVCACDDGEAA